jgi:pimeloyl-ACP methyl ester carboxylesterase
MIVENIFSFIFFILAALFVGFIWGYTPYRASWLDAKYARFRSDFQEAHDAIDAKFNHQDRVVNGIHWHYVDEGARDGGFVLFMHGLPECWYSWSKVLSYVDQGYRLVAIDMKGFGRSEMRDPNYNWHVVAAQILDLMTDLGADKFYVVGHDWGSVISSVLVSDHPEHILGYVRMEADLIPRGSNGLLAFYMQKPQWLLFQSRWIASFMMQNPGWFIDLVYPKRMVTPFDPVDRNYLVYEFSRPGVAKMNPLYFKHSNWDLEAVTTKICKNNFSFPVLQLQADSDPAQPRSLFNDVANVCHNIELVWVTNASHFDNLDQPEQVAKAINNFLHKRNLDST